MACTINRDTIANAVKNKQDIIIYDTPNPSITEIMEAVDFMTANHRLGETSNKLHEDDDGQRYGLINIDGSFYSDSFYKSRVTHKVDKAFRKGKSKEKISEIRNDTTNIYKREIGTKLHYLSQQLGELYYNQKIGKASTKSLLDIKKEASGGDYTIPSNAIDNLNLGIKEIIDGVFARQSQINPAVNPQMRFEVFLGDPVKDVAGTMDVLAGYSDGTAEILDYKFMSPSYTRGTDVVGYGNSAKLVNNQFITAKKKKNWHLQMSDYKKMSLKLYKFKDVLSTRIVPIWIDLEYVDGKATKKLNKLQIGKTQSKFLDQIHATYAKTGVQQIDEFLTARYTEIEILKSKLSKADFSEKAKIRERINKIEQAATTFVETQNIERLVDDVIKTIQPYYKRLNAGEVIPFPELNEVIQYTKSLVDFEQVFRGNYNFIVQQNPALAQAIKDSLSKEVISKDSSIKTLSDKINRGILPLLALFEQHRKQLIFKDANIKDESELVAEDFFTATFLPMSDFRDKIVQFTQSKFSEAYTNINQDLKGIVEEITIKDNAVVEWLKSKGQSPNDLMKYILDSNGYLVNSLSSVFYTDKAKATSNNNSLWFVQNFEIKSKNYLNETYSRWYTRAKAEHEEDTKDRYEYLLTESRDKYLTKLDNEFTKWQEFNDLSLSSDGTALFPNAWMNSSWLTPKQSTKDKYVSEEYKVIANNQPLLDYYNLILNLNDKYRQMLGYDTVSKNFMPRVRADILEKMFNLDGKGLIQELREVFEIREDVQGFGMIDTETGAIEKQIPIYFTNPFRDAEGNIDLGQQSKDIRRSLILFAKMAHTHKYMSEIEATVLAAKEVQSSLDYTKTGAKGQKVFDFMHNIAKVDKAKGKSMVEQVLQNAIDYHLYGIKVQPFAENPKLTNNILRAKRYLSLKALGLGFIPATAGYVAARIQAWTEGKKGVIYNSEHWNNSTKLQVTQFDKYHALAYFFGVHNDDILQQIKTSGSKIGNLIGDRTYREGLRKYINDRTWLRPFSYLDERLDNHIAVAMSQNYGVDTSGNVRRIENLPEGSTTLWDLFNYSKDQVSFGNFTDEQLRSIITQFKNAVRAGQRGIKGTMNEEDINYAQTNLILNLMTQFKTWMPGVVNERFGRLKYNEILDAPQWGRYRALWNEVEFKNDASTALYILKSTANLAGYVAKDMLTFAPLFRVFGKKDIKVDNEKALIYYTQWKNQNPYSELTFNDFMRVKKAAIRASLMELQIMLIFTALIMSLGADWDDDGKPLYKDNILLHKIYQVVNRAQTELQFTLNPFEYAKVINNPFPIASLATELAKLLNNTADEFTDSIFGEDKLDEFITGKKPSRDQNQKFYFLFGMIPGVRGMDRMLNMSEQAQKATR